MSSFASLLDTSLSLLASCTVRLCRVGKVNGEEVSYGVDQLRRLWSVDVAYSLQLLRVCLSLSPLDGASIA